MSSSRYYINLSDRLLETVASPVTASENRRMGEEGRKFTFSWQAAGHARVVRLLVTEQMRSGLWRPAKWLVLVIVAVSWLFVGLAVWTRDWASIATLSPLLVAVTALLAGFGYITGWLRALQVRKTDPNIRHPFTYEFRESGLRLDLHTVSSELRWAGMARIRETADMFLFYYNRRMACFLPKRAVGASPDIDALRGWIRLRLPEGVEYVTDAS